MPTGYTAKLYEGKPQDFRAFVLSCARAMGACVMQRDDPTDDPPKVQEASPYYAERLAAAQARYADLQSMTPEQAEAEAFKEYDEARAREAEYAAKREAIAERYHAMIAEVEVWTPPTQDHVGLKEFMLDQLRESLKWDCGSFGDPPKRLSGPEWHRQASEKAYRDIGYFAEELAKEEARTSSRNRWITALYDSLATASVAE